MYISKISLKNIRGFKSLEFDLDRGGGEFAGWTVFTGSNGSGKSSLLSETLGRALCGVREPLFPGRSPTREEALWKRCS